MKQHVLVTGGTGYIGSHTVVCLLQAGYEVTIVDSLCNSKKSCLDRIFEITGTAPVFVQADIGDRHAMQAVFAAKPVDAVVHFAALKAVGESVADPLRYYRNNVAGTLVLLEVMREYGVRTLVFSSSATVYGAAEEMPLREDAPLGAVNPYGRTKLMMEQMLQDVTASEAGWKVALLRYFNPIGAHESGRIGEDPSGIPNNLLPYVAQVAVGRRPYLQVFGDDYPTPDGTGVRDYIHVVDLADGHLRALEVMAAGSDRVLVCNLGTGQGYSVRDVVHAFEKASGREIPCRMMPRRDGDCAVCYADPHYAAEVLGWRAHRDMDAMCRDTWRWQSQNPNGYS